MKTDIPLLADIRVASPCHAAWKNMEGDDQTRFCSLCRKNVYNLSEMTRQEAETLIREKEGKMCVRYYQRSDGTVLTKDCPIGVAVVRRILLARAVSASALLVTVIALFGRDIRAALLSDNTPRVVAGGMSAIPSQVPVTSVTLGEVAEWTPSEKGEPLMGDVAVIECPSSEKVEPPKSEPFQGRVAIYVEKPKLKK